MTYDTTYYGWKPDIPDWRDRHAKVTPRAKLPGKFDLRGSGFMPRVYDQLPLGSCTANAIAAAHEFEQRAQGQRAFTPSRLAIYWQERFIENSVESDAGAFIRDGMKVVSKLGVAPEELWPYDIRKFRQEPPASYCDAALAHQALEYKRVAKSVATIKTVMMDTHRMVVFGFTVPENFESDECLKTGLLELPTKTEAILGGHAVCKCGWDDSVVFKRTRTRGAWICRNSWGEDVMDGGYFYMPYAYTSRPGLSSDLWVLTRVE